MTELTQLDYEKKLRTTSKPLPVTKNYYFILYSAVIVSTSLIKMFTLI